MIDYLYRTTSTSGNMALDDEVEMVRCLIREKIDEVRPSSRFNLLVQDTGEHHEGLTVTVQVYHNSAAVNAWQGNRKLPKSDYLSICHVELSETKVRELIAALSSALAMRQFDDE